MGEKGEGGVKNLKKWVTSFLWMPDQCRIAPYVLLFLCEIIIRTSVNIYKKSEEKLELLLDANVDVDG